MKKRSEPKCGPCKECGLPAYYRTACCGHWRCWGASAWLTNHGIEHAKLRKVRNATGVYRLVCVPSCRQRMRPEAVQASRQPVPRATREYVGKAKPLPGYWSEQE